MPAVLNQVFAILSDRNGALRWWPLLLPFVLLYGCVRIPHTSPANVEVSLLPKASSDATEILYLQSNVNCQFFVDGQSVITRKRVRMLVTKKDHQLVCKPEGYRAKEEYVQPPYDPSHPIGFTFLLEDKLSSETVVAENATKGVTIAKADGAGARRQR